MAKSLSRCPVCEGTLGISEYACGRCHTKVSGSFEGCRFCRLAPEHLSLIEVFLRCEGNLTRVEKEIGLSYPTLRNKLSAALAALGLSPDAEAARESQSSYPPNPPAPTPSKDPIPGRTEVLDALANGTMSAEQAADVLRRLSE